MNQCYCPCHEFPGVYPTTRRRPCSSCGHVNSDGHIPGAVRDGWEYNFTPNERAVLEVLREHSRTVLTLVWGIHELSGARIGPFEVRNALEMLEQKGLVRESPLSSEEGNEWWRLTKAGKGISA